MPQSLVLAVGAGIGLFIAYVAFAPFVEVLYGLMCHYFICLALLDWVSAMFDVMNGRAN